MRSNTTLYHKKRESRSPDRRDRGIGLIVIILVLAFMAGVGLMLVTVTASGTRVAGNLRWQEEAYNAAETGFDAAWAVLENAFTVGGWTSFEGHYLKDPTGIDDPDLRHPESQQHYFRRLTDEELLNVFTDNSIDQTTNGVLFFREPYVLDSGGAMDPRFTYTAFLLDDEVGLNTTDATDVLLVCIGTAGEGNNLVTSRIEVMLAIE
jgi:hypothetical protein